MNGPNVNINGATEVDEKVTKTVQEMFLYSPWNPEQVEKGRKVRNALEEAVLVIIENVPPSPDRSVAIRKLREARMDCNSAITHGGKY